MAKIYYSLIKSGKWRIEDVPKAWRAEVEKMLREDNAY